MNSHFQMKIYKWTARTFTNISIFTHQVNVNQNSLRTKVYKLLVGIMLVQEKKGCRFSSSNPDYMSTQRSTGFLVSDTVSILLSKS